jgi:hypothetical protein
MLLPCFCAQSHHICFCLLFGFFLEKEYNKIKDFAANSVPGKKCFKTTPWFRRRAIQRLTSFGAVWIMHCIFSRAFVKLICTKIRGSTMNRWGFSTACTCSKLMDDWAYMLQIFGVFYSSFIFGFIRQLDKCCYVRK